MQSGDATILLRPEHAPRAPLPQAGPAPLPPPRLTAELRRVRIARHAPLLNGHGDVKREPLDDVAPTQRDTHLRRLLELAPLARPEPDGEAGSLAAAIFARAVLLCRAELYPGLHTIIAAPPAPAPAPAQPPAPAPAPAPTPAPAPECAWCARVWCAPRCLWYGAPRRTPLGARAWRREGARRYLCACCGDGGDGQGVGEAEGEAAVRDADGGGWYGKGYRKGRRRR